MLVKDGLSILLWVVSRKFTIVVGVENFVEIDCVELMSKSDAKKCDTLLDITCAICEWPRVGNMRYGSNVRYDLLIW